MNLINRKELRLKLSVLSDTDFDFLVTTAQALEALNLRYCNGSIDSAQFESMLSQLAIPLKQIKGLPAIVIQHDPRGPAVRLLFADKSYNTWGGEEHGYGILFDESAGDK